MKIFLHVGLFIVFASSPAFAEVREWTSRNGVTFKADFVSASDKVVTLSVKGKTHVVKLADLSLGSQGLARALQQAQSKRVVKPFPHGTDRLLAKMKKIHISRISFSKTPLPEVMQEIMARSWANDTTETNPAARGIPIVVEIEGNPSHWVTADMTNMSVKGILDFVTGSAAQCTYQVRNNVVAVIGEASQPVKEAASGDPFTDKLLSGRKASLTSEAKSRGLDILFYRVDMKMIDEMSGDAAAGIRSDPFSAAEPENVAKIQNFLRDSGIKLDKSAGHQFLFDGFQVMVTSSSANVARVKKLLEGVRAKTRNRK